MLLIKETFALVNNCIVRIEYIPINLTMLCSKAKFTYTDNTIVLMVKLHKASRSVFSNSLTKYIIHCPSPNMFTITVFHTNASTEIHKRKKIISPFTLTKIHVDADYTNVLK